MPIIRSRVALNSPIFPLLSENMGRSAIVNWYDSPQPSEQQQPQVYYAHNVMPTHEGYQSVAYTQIISPALFNDFDNVFTIREGSTNRQALFAVTKEGKFAVATLSNPNWVEVAAPVGIANKFITTAYVRGITYFFIYRFGCYVYNFDTNTMNPVSLTALDVTRVNGIVANSGYLLAFGESNEIAVSSSVSATDFTPSLATGAFAGSIEGAQGETVAAISTQSGVIFLQRNNAVAAVFSSNGRYPFNFNVIIGSGGSSDPNFAAHLTLDSPVAYAYTTSGLQIIDTREAKFILPEITDFLSGRRLETFNEFTNTLTVTTPTNVLKKKLAWIADRYLVISYGDGALTHAIIVDVALNRIGKLKVDHVAIFEFTLYDQTIYETPKKSIGVLKSDGTVYVVNTDLTATGSNGVMILGKYQFVRTNWIQLVQVDLENIPTPADFQLLLAYTYDGKVLQTPIAGYNRGDTGLNQTYLFDKTALAHSLICKGRFNLVSGVIGFNVTGTL